MREVALEKEMKGGALQLVAKLWGVAEKMCYYCFTLFRLLCFTPQATREIAMVIRAANIVAVCGHLFVVVLWVWTVQGHATYHLLVE